MPYRIKVQKVRGGEPTLACRFLSGRAGYTIQYTHGGGVYWQVQCARCICRYVGSISEKAGSISGVDGKYQQVVGGKYQRVGGKY
jgi:hypothetical protein